MGLHFKGQGHSSPHSPGSYTVMRPIRRLPARTRLGPLSPSSFLPPRTKATLCPRKLSPLLPKTSETITASPRIPAASLGPHVTALFPQAGENGTAFGFALSFPLPSHSSAVCSSPSWASHSRCQTSCLSARPSLSVCLWSTHINLTRHARRRRQCLCVCSTLTDTVNVSRLMLSVATRENVAA